MVEPETLLEYYMEQQINKFYYALDMKNREKAYTVLTNTVETFEELPVAATRHDEDQIQRIMNDLDEVAELITEIPEDRFPDAQEKFRSTLLEDNIRIPAGDNPYKRNQD